jgi:hypothetical protein
VNPFLDLQAQAAARLNHASLAAVPRLTEDPKDPLNVAFKALYQGSLPANAAGKSGVCLILNTPAARGGGGGTGLVVGELTLQVEIYELVPLNRDATAGIGVAALDVLWAVIDRLHGWRINGMAPVEFTEFTSEDYPDRPGLLAYFVQFACAGGFTGSTDTDDPETDP